MARTGSRGRHAGRGSDDPSRVWDALGSSCRGPAFGSAVGRGWHTRVSARELRLHSSTSHHHLPSSPEAEEVGAFGPWNPNALQLKLLGVRALPGFIRSRRPAVWWTPRKGTIEPSTGVAAGDLRVILYVSAVVPLKHCGDRTVLLRRHTHNIFRFLFLLSHGSISTCL